MLPPGGSGVSRVMPASSSASELASAMCPSRRLMNTGLSGVTASISWRVGRSAGVQRSWSQLPLSTQRRSEEHTSELQSLMRISYAVFCLKNKQKETHTRTEYNIQSHY